MCEQTEPNSEFRRRWQLNYDEFVANSRERLSDVFSFSSRWTRNALATSWSPTTIIVSIRRPTQRTQPSWHRGNTRRVRPHLTVIFMTGNSWTFDPAKRIRAKTHRSKTYITPDYTIVFNVTAVLTLESLANKCILLLHEHGNVVPVHFVR